MTLVRRDLVIPARLALPHGATVDLPAVGFAQQVTVTQQLVVVPLDVMALRARLVVDDAPFCESFDGTRRGDEWSFRFPPLQIQRPQRCGIVLVGKLTDGQWYACDIEAGAPC